MSDEEPLSPTEWFIAETSLESPHHPKRRKNRQRRNKARRQRQLAEQAASHSPEFEDVHKTQQVEERKFPRDEVIDWLEPEIEDGNIEYKLKIKDPNSVRFQQLVTQMKFRLSEGNGECYYCLGVADDGYPRGLPAEELHGSIEGVFKMAELLHAKAEIIWQFLGGFGQECVVIKITRSLKDHLEVIDIRIGVIGGMDVGKSTLIACLTTGQDGESCLDNGHGSARTNVLKHKHEIETGHTSTVSKHLLGYDDQGQILNYCGLSAMTPAEIGLAASRLVNLIDMGGRDRFLKTIFKGLTSMSPDYVLLCISSVCGVTKITRQHLTVALALNIPTIFVITKTDLASSGVIQSIHDEIRALGKIISKSTSASEAAATPFTPSEIDCLRIITTENEAKSVAVELTSVKTGNQSNQGALPFIAPVVSISTVSGQGLDLLHCLLNALQGSQYLIDEEVCFQVDQVFKVEGVGTVLSGLLISGSMTIGQKLKLGPDQNGDFNLVQIRSIQCSQVPIRTIRAGQTATISASLISPSVSDAEDTRLPEQDMNCIEQGDEFRSIKDVMKMLIKIKAQYGKTSSLQLEAELEGHVLLGLKKKVVTSRGFEAVVVLLGGQWPPRGLLSGRWPPTDFLDSESDGQSGSSCGNSRSLHRQSLSPSPSRRQKTHGCYQVIIYSRSTRQAAHIVSMEELTSQSEDKLLTGSMKAAAAVGSVTETEEDEEDADYCVARVGFLLQSNPEWLKLDEVLIVRDQTNGYLSGIGVITQI